MARRAEIEHQIIARVKSKVGNQVWGQVVNQVVNQVVHQVRGPIWNQGRVYDLILGQAMEDTDGSTGSS